MTRSIHPCARAWRTPALFRLAHCAVGFVAAAGTLVAAPIGVFQGPTDVGTVSRPTVASYDPRTDTYTISASGDNMWARSDAFGFVWTRVEGDVAIAANITFVGSSAQGHRKACLMFRRSLEHDSAYADVAVHGDGLTSLQFRSEAGGLTREVQCLFSAPRRVRLEKRGDYILLQASGPDGALVPSGCTVRLPFDGPFYVGLAVCAHDNAAVETAVFSRVELGPSRPPAELASARTFALETIPLSSLDRRVVYRTTDRIESPHFSRDGAALFFNTNGRIHRLALPGDGPPVVIDTGFATRCTNAHGLSPDGTQLVLGHIDETDVARIYFVPTAGGTPTPVELAASATWHGWSPDGETLAYSATREGNLDIYTIPVAGGDEARLTDTPGLDGGADYSADGQWIYFHSDRNGRMQIWRMQADGSNPEQITTDNEFHNWFPHPSPNGESIVFLSGPAEPTGPQPPDGDYFLRLLPAGGGEPREIARFYGGDGTLNVPSWSPDSAQIAYVTSEPPHESTDP